MRKPPKSRSGSGYGAQESVLLNVSQTVLSTSSLGSLGLIGEVVSFNLRKIIKFLPQELRAKTTKTKAAVNKRRFIINPLQALPKYYSDRFPIAIFCGLVSPFCSLVKLKIGYISLVEASSTRSSNPTTPLTRPTVESRRYDA